MRVVITGATGLIGRAVVSALVDRGDEVVALTRDVARSAEVLGHGVRRHEWPDPLSSPPAADALADADAVINLLGEPVAQRWSEDAKRRIRESRVLGTRNLIAALDELPAPSRPKILVSQSATGYYGLREDELLDEEASAGDDFLAQVAVAWEREAEKAPSGTRVVLTRTGVVLAHGGGALARMLVPFRLGVGGPVAGGRQFVPWIHLDDVVGGVLHCLGDGDIAGPVNLTAPEPLRNHELSQALGAVLHRPAMVPVPALALKLLYGEMASIVIGGQRAVPQRLTEQGYEFVHPELEPALRDVV